MAAVEVTPEEFSLVEFDAARIAAIAQRLVDAIGLDRDVRVEVDEASPLGRIRVASLDPVVVQVQGGAFEDTRRPRKPSDARVADSLGRVLLRVRDRLDPAFGEPPADGELGLAESVAWDVYAIGRLARLGYPVQRQRRLYQFRTRHGFSDEVDAVFERLWTGDGLTWAEIRDASASLAAAAA